MPSNRTRGRPHVCSYPDCSGHPVNCFRSKYIHLYIHTFTCRGTNMGSLQQALHFFKKIPVDCVQQHVISQPEFFDTNQHARTHTHKDKHMHSPSIYKHTHDFKPPTNTVFLGTSAYFSFKWIFLHKATHHLFFLPMRPPKTTISLTHR